MKRGTVKSQNITSFFAKRMHGEVSGVLNVDSIEMGVSLVIKYLRQMGFGII